MLCDCIACFVVVFVIRPTSANVGESMEDLFIALINFCFIVFFFQILQAGEVGVIERLERYKTSSTKPAVAKHQQRQPDPRSQAVQQLAILDVVLETTARLTWAATVM